LLVHGRWFSLGTPASSTTKAGRHDIAEILLKVGLSTKKSINQSKSIFTSVFVSVMIFVLFVCVLFYLFIFEEGLVFLNPLFSIVCFVGNCHFVLFLLATVQ
jgi:hypothetical protein